MTDSDFIGSGDSFTLQGLSRVTGQTVHAIRQHIAAGCPVEVTGDKSRDWAINLRQYTEWFIAYRIGETDSETARFKVARAQRMNADAERMEAELEQAEHGTLTIGEAIALVDHELSLIEKHTRKYPAVVKRALVKMDATTRRDPVFVQDVLEDTLETIIAALRDDPSEAVQP